MSNTKKTKEILTLDQWAEDFSISVSQEIYRTLDGIEKEKQGKLHTKLPLAFLSRFVAITVYKTLTARPAHIKDNNAAYEYTLKEFNELKVATANAVASGFTAAMQQYSGKEVDYMCLIKLMPEPVNTKPC